MAGNLEQVCQARGSYARMVGLLPHLDTVIPAESGILKSKGIELLPGDPAYHNGEVSW
jgi:hypothetical protein